MRATILEVDCIKFQNNINKIKEYIGHFKEIMPVIKANAYGTYLNKKKEILNQFNIVAVAIVNEGIELRKIGYDKDIFVLNQPSIDEIDEIIENSLTIGISSIEFFKECIKKNARFKVHLEIETGMNRTGIKVEDLEKYLDLLKNSNLIIEGIYSHLSSADYDQEYTSNQIDKFDQAIELVKNKYNLKYIHVEASSGILNISMNETNIVRPGIMIYGYLPFETENFLNLEPITKLKTKITFIKECKENDKIGYSQNYTCKGNETIATIPIGYADGLRRELSNKGYVILNNKKAKIVGNICMDSCMINVTGMNAKVGDTVYIWDNINQTVEDIAKECNTINYEILSTISDRVERVFIEKES